MPHWSCHYYRLETGSSFVVGAWSFSPLDSVISLLLYGVLASVNLISITCGSWRAAVAATSGFAHLTIGAIHVYRLARPFRFEIFDHPWSLESSLREVLVIVPFGLLSLFVAWTTVRFKSTEDSRIQNSR